MSEYTFKNLNEIDTRQEPAEGTTVMGFENGLPIQMPMNAIKSGGGVFVVDTDSSEYQPTNATYGDTVKEALLSGKTIWIYMDNEYYSVFYFYVGDNSGVPTLYLRYNKPYSGSVSTYTLTFTISSIE